MLLPSQWHWLHCNLKFGSELCGIEQIYSSDIILFQFFVSVSAFEKALLYYDTKELPVGWNKSEMLGSDIEDDDDDNAEDEYVSKAAKPYGIP